MAFICLHDHEIGVLMSLSSAAEIKVYINLLQRRNAKTKTAHPGYGRIARDIGASRRTVARALRELQRCGLIRWERRTVPNRDEPDSNLYTFPIHDAAECGRGSVTDDTRVVSPMTLGSVTDDTQTKRRQLDEQTKKTEAEADDRSRLSAAIAAAAQTSSDIYEWPGAWDNDVDQLYRAGYRAADAPELVRRARGWFQKYKKANTPIGPLEIVAYLQAFQPEDRPVPSGPVERPIPAPRNADGTKPRRTGNRARVRGFDLGANLRWLGREPETAQDRVESPTSDETDTPKGKTGTGSGSRPEGRVERVAREPVVFGDRYGDRITRPTETIIRRRRRPAVQYDDGAMVAAAGGGD